MASAQTEPKRLKRRCPAAALFAITLPETEAMIGVIQVPILPPRTSAAARSKVIQPLLHIISAMAKVALEACTTIVSTRPTPAKISTDQKPRSE